MTLFQQAPWKERRRLANESISYGLAFPNLWCVEFHQSCIGYSFFILSLPANKYENPYAKGAFLWLWWPVQSKYSAYIKPYWVISNTDSWCSSYRLVFDAEHTFTFSLQQSSCHVGELKHCKNPLFFFVCLDLVLDENNDRDCVRITHSTRYWA